MGKRKVVTTRLDEDLFKTIKHLAVDLDRPANDLIEEGLKYVIKKYEKKARGLERK